MSIFDLFKIGIGPSSSHTVGPMKAANLFVNALSQQQLMSQVTRVKVELFGSLGATGNGHGSDIAVMLGLMGEQPHSTDVVAIPQKINQIKNQRTLCLNQQQEIHFVPETDLILNGKTLLPHHPNALTITAYADDKILYQNTYYSIGGGFVQTEQEAKAQAPVIGFLKKPVPYPFKNAKELLQICQTHQCSIAQVVRANELTNLSENELNDGLNAIWQVMQDCVTDGCQNDGILPGGLQVQRRAKAIYQQLLATDSRKVFNDALAVIDWVNLYALTVNEENASGGRVVTAPTNGAAGVIPAVMHYYRDFCPSYTLDGLHDFC